VVVGGVVGDVLRALVGDDDGGDVSSADVRAAASGAGLAGVGEVVFVPGDDDGPAERSAAPDSTGCRDQSSFDVHLSFTPTPAPTGQDAAQMNVASNVAFDGRPTPRLVAKATRVRRGVSRQALGIGFMFVEPPPARVQGLIHAVPENADATLCGIDAAAWKVVPGVGWTTGLTNGCPQCLALTPRYPNG
jgi:hypothetical protein